MRWLGKFLILLAFAGLVIGGIVLTPAAQMRLRANRIIYLQRNAHEYQKALHEYERLKTDYAGRELPLPDDFVPRMIEHAHQHYFYGRGKDQEYEELLKTVEQRGELAPLARKNRLEFRRGRDAKSSRTLEAARAILKHDGYHAGALWLATINQYDERRPNVIPPELLVFRQHVKQTPAGKNKPTAQEMNQRLLLSGLLALADQDWAQAAEKFEAYRMSRAGEAQRGVGADREPLDLPHGLALLKAGRPEAALHYISQYRLKNPADKNGLIYLTEAYLALEKFPWAAATLQELRTLAPSAENTIFAEHFGAAAGSKPLITLCASLTDNKPMNNETGLWTWLGMIARTDEERRSVDAAAAKLLASRPHEPETQAALLEYYLGHNRVQEARLLIDAATTSPTQAAAGGKVFFDEQRRKSIQRLIEWYLKRNQPDGQKLVARNQPKQTLLQRNRTERFDLNLPAGATMVVLFLASYPAGKVWPIVHIDLAGWGRRDIYAHDSQPQARPFILPLKHPSEHEQKISAAVSLLNGKEGERESRYVMIAEVVAF